MARNQASNPVKVAMEIDEPPIDNLSHACNLPLLSGQQLYDSSNYGPSMVQMEGR